MNLLMSRYILEIEKDSKLFKMFNDGKWYPNFDKYRGFMHKQEKNNNSFAKTIDRSSCYISNGIFHDTENLALHMVGCGSFVVGVCDNPNSLFYQENMKRIEEFRKLLDKKKIHYRTYKHNNHRDKTLILYYRSDSL